MFLPRPVYYHSQEGANRFRPRNTWSRSDRGAKQPWQNVTARRSSMRRPSSRPLESRRRPDVALGGLRQRGDEGGSRRLIGTFGGYAGGVGSIVAERRRDFTNYAHARDRHDFRDQGEPDVRLAFGHSRGDPPAALLRHRLAFDLVRHAHASPQLGKMDSGRATNRRVAERDH